jgi:membrane associated rhomboid family serine protease
MSIPLRIHHMREAHMLFIVAALALMGVLLGAAAHTPLPVFLAASGVIGAWLLVFFIRERTGHKES